MREADDSTTPVETSDAHLMTQIVSGSANAFEQLYDRYCPRAYAVAASVCRDAGHTEEAVQEAFISVWHNRSIYRVQRGTVASWLMCVVHYRAIDVARRSGRHASRRADEEAIECYHAPANLAERVFARDRAARLRAQLDQLPKAQREVIALAYYGQLTHAEIATQLALPPGTVKGRMRLGLQKLRIAIEEAA